MQTQKARNGSPDVLKKLSPRSARPLKLAALEPDSSSSPISANNRTPKDKSLKVSDRKPLRSPVSEEFDLKFGGISDERAGLAAVVKEIRQLTLQTEMVASSEAGHVRQAEMRNSEIHLLRGNLMDTLLLVDNFRKQLKDCEVTDTETEALATETLRQLESAKKSVEELKSDGKKAVDSYKKLAVELEQSKSRMIWLEGLVTKLLANPGGLESHDTLIEYYGSLKPGESKARLVDKKTVLQKNPKETGVEAELKQLWEAMESLKAELVDKETELQIVSDENETLIHKMETDVQDALMKLGVAMKEANKNSQRAIRVTWKLDATQASNSEMETELRKLQVQSNQWRKAAGATTAVLSAGNNNHQTNSPYSEEIDYEVTKKKTGNVLKRIGGFWKKPRK